jgi:Mrp family chromosome partitioning ATPase
MGQRRKAGSWAAQEPPVAHPPSRPIVVGVVASERSWRAELVSYAHNHVSGLRLRILREPRAAFTPEVDTVVADDSSTLLVPRVVRDLQALGKRVIGVFDDEGAGAGEALLEQLGVDLRVRADVAPEELARLIVALGPAERLDAELDELLGTEGPGTDLPTSAGRGVVVAIGGPHGAGATEVTLGLAGALARGSTAVLAVDLDVVYPGVARRLRYGLDRNLLSTLDAATYEGRSLTDALATRAEGAPGVVPFDVVGGLANPADWAEVGEEDVTTLLDDARAGWSYVVLDVGGGLEDLDVDGRERFGAPRGALARAGAVVAVGEASRLGVLRLLDWAASAHELAPALAIHVVLNRAPRSPARRRQLAIEVDEGLGPLLAGMHFVGAEEAVAAAAWDGRPLGRGRLSRTCRRLATAMPVPSAYAVEARTAAGGDR